MYLLAWLTDFDSMFDEFGGWYFASLFIFLCWTGLFHGIRYYELQQEEHQSVLQAEAAARDEQIKRIEAQSIARDAQLKMLRYQLNPHFLSNTLNAINSLIELNEADKAQKMTVQLSQFLRYSLDNDPDTTIALKKEIDATNLYLEIEKTRFGDHLEINYEVAEEAEQALVPSLLLQPIIENSMKHAISKNEQGGKISIKARKENTRLILVLSDTGNGSPTEEPTKQGVGLKNIQQRLKTLYDNDHELIFSTDIGPGLTTIINLPYETLS
jgi:LytS/YehU family sensor histidine kinase